MLTYSQKTNNPAELFSLFCTASEKVLYFDIETTGLSADTSFIYLICAGFLKDGVPTLIQWFCEGPADEVNVIRAFLDFANGFSAIIHFNGATFDIPFVEKRAAKYGLDSMFRKLSDSAKSIDLYKKIRPYRDLFGLCGCRQKNIEAFMGIGREDKFGGGELIEVYKQYLGRSRYDCMTHGTPLLVHKDSGLAKMPETQSEALLYLLLLHNAEDVENLINISALYPVLQILEGNAGSKNTHVLTEVAECGSSVTVTFAPKCVIPVPSFCGRTGPDGTFNADFDGQKLVLSIPVFVGELKYFYDNYKDYYYLPDEDCAIYKSAGEGVDKSRRKNATAATCYTKINSRFIPLPQAADAPIFKSDYKSRQTFIELSSFEKLMPQKQLEAIMKALEKR